MTSLIQRISNFAEQTENLELKNILESIVSYGKYSNDRALITILTEKCVEFMNESHNDFIEFLNKEKRFYWIREGISISLMESLEGLDCLETQPILRGRVNELKKIFESSKTSLEFILRTKNSIESFKWIDEVNNVFEALDTELLRFRKDIDLYHVIATVPAVHNNPLTGSIFERLHDFLLNQNTAAIRPILETMKPYTSHQFFLTLYENLDYHYVQNTNSPLEKSIIDSDSRINELVSPICLTNDGNIAFFAFQRILEYNLQDNTVRFYEDESEFNANVNESDSLEYQKLLTFISAPNVKLTTESIDLDISGYGKVSIVLNENDESELYIKGTKVTNNDIEKYIIGENNNPKLVQYASQIKHALSYLPKFKLVHFDNVKILEAANVPNTGILLFKNPNEKLNAVKFNPTAKEYVILENMNSYQVVDFVNKFLHVNIGRALNEMRVQDNKNLQMIDDELKTLIESIELTKSNIERITFNKQRLNESSVNEDFDDVLIALNESLAEQKERYNILQKRRENFLSVNEILSVDSFTLPYNNGQTQRYDVSVFDTVSSMNPNIQVLVTDDPENEYLFSRNADDGISPGLYPGDCVHNVKRNTRGYIINVNKFEAYVQYDGTYKILATPLSDLRRAQKNNNDDDSSVHLINHNNNQR